MACGSCRCFGLVPQDQAKSIYRNVSGREMFAKKLPEALFHAALILLERENGTHIPTVRAGKPSCSLAFGLPRSSSANPESTD